MRRGVDASRAADYYAGAASAAGSAGVSIHDADAIQLLEAKVAKLEALREEKKRVNTAYRKAGKPRKVEDEGWDRFAKILDLKTNSSIVEAAKAVMSENYWMKSPLDTSELSRKIRYTKKRLEEVRAEREREEAEEVFELEGDGWSVEEIEDRLVLSLPGRIPKEKFREIRRSGWLWSRNFLAFVRKNTPNGRASAQHEVPRILNPGAAS